MKPNKINLRFWTEISDFNILLKAGISSKIVFF